MLTLHPEIESSAETWFFLNALGWMAPVDIQTEFDYRACRIALSEFYRGDRAQRLNQALNLAAASFADDPTKIFIDKTPRYALILNELRQCLPDCKIILLFRNPLSVADSMVDAWGDGGRRWRMRPYFVDLYKGLERMHAFAEVAKDDPNTLVVKYEDVVKMPSETFRDIAKFLDLSNFAPDFSKIAEQQVTGTMGDKVGIHRYREISIESLGKLKHFCNPLRRHWGRRYLNWFGEQRLETIGYKKRELEHQLGSAKGYRYIGRDILESLFQLAKLLTHVRRFSSREARSKMGEMSELS